jgi:hypothetical protein
VRLNPHKTSRGFGFGGHEGCPKKGHLDTDHRFATEANLQTPGCGAITNPDVTLNHDVVS